MGAAGDMLTAALLELLPDRDAFLQKLNSRGIPGVTFSYAPSVKCGITGTHMTVTVNGQEEDEHMQKITVTKPDYFKDDTLNELAKQYMEQGYTILMLEKDSDLSHYVEGFKEADWYTEGFKVCYHIGDNATGYSGYTFVFKATEKQLQGYLENQHFMINDDREQHNQKRVKFGDFWKKSTDAEGNIIYKASWKGPEPEMKLLPSDRARFTNYELTYDPTSHIAVCVIEDGGGIG